MSFFLFLNTVLFLGAAFIEGIKKNSHNLNGYVSYR